jgi:predicted enzyme related to lactoylglutathione lyase
MAVRSAPLILAVSLPLTTACAMSSKSTTTTSTIGSTSSATSAGAALPGVTETTGRFLWHDLITDDIAAAQKFYTELFGWSYTKVTRDGRTYVIAWQRGQLVGGIVAIDPVANQEVSQWIAYQSVANVDDAVAAVQRGGGRTVAGPIDLDAGRAAVVADPQGAPFGLLRLKGADPAEPAAPVEGTFFWMEYLAREPAAAVTFYTSTFGFAPSVTDRVGTTEYVVLTTGRPRGAILPSPKPELRPLWLPYLLVSEPAQLVTRVRSLGGDVLLEPNAGVRKGSLAVVTDPSGAVVALQKYPF